MYKIAKRPRRNAGFFVVFFFEKFPRLRYDILAKVY